MLELRPNCEICDADLPPASDKARICSYECTFCADCADTTLHDVCPNCGGNLMPRPIRPAQSHRPGTGLDHHPGGTRRRQNGYSVAQRAVLTARLRDVKPENR